ncbi:MAG TPA: DNA methyltransferase [Chloroflexota bacterium]|nr:DNA methyltransferase [Chloroflexota bacterium]
MLPRRVDPNRIRPEDSAAHEWYRFVLSFPPHLVKQYVAKFGLENTSLVLDPFCGTGTTPVECKKLGIASVGIEANPMAEFAARVIADWGIDPDLLESHAHQVARKAAENLATQGIVDEPLNGQALAGAVALRSLAPESMRLLLADSIRPLALHKSLALLDVIELELRDDRVVDHERLAFAKATVACVSNLHFGPEVGVDRLKLSLPVLPSWLNEIRIMAADLRALRGNRGVPARILRGDARQDLGQVLEPRAIDGVITSPPYPNEKDYTRTTRLESVLLGFIRDRSQLRSLKHSLVRSNTRNVYKLDDDDKLVANNARIQEIAAQIEARRLELGKTSGFERLYARVTKLYFGGMARHLSELKPYLRPGARLAYVVGDQASYLRVLINTGEILGDIASSLGYELDSIDLWRTRRGAATRAQLREEVVCLRWPG